MKEALADAAAPRRVLVADDNRDAADSLGILLSQAGYDVRVVHNGADAQMTARVFQPHVAILDIGMPGLSGYAVAEGIRAEPWGARVLLIALTGWGQPRDRARAARAGFNHHCTKPLEPDVLNALLASARFDG